MSDVEDNSKAVEVRKGKQVSFSPNVSITFICSESPTEQHIVLETKTSPLDPEDYVKERPKSIKVARNLNSKRTSATMPPTSSDL